MQDSLVVNRRDSLVSIFNKMLRARASREDTFAKFSLLLVARAEECACSNITLSSAMPSEEAIIITIVERIGLQKSKSKVLLWLGEEASRKAWIELKKLSFDVNVILVMNDVASPRRQMSVRSRNCSNFPSVLSALSRENATSPIPS